MDLFSLVASLTLDINPFVTGIGTARSVFTGFADVVTQGVQAAGRAAWDFMKDVVDTGMEVDKQYSAVQAVLGREEGTIENMNRLREHGLDVARNSIFTAQEVGEAYYYMGMAGWKTEQQLAGLNGIINLAAAADEDLARTSDIVTDSLTAFGLGAGQAQRFADVLAMTATNANTDVAKMGATFKYIAPVAGSLGYSIEDVATSIGLIADAGIKGSQAGTSLRNIMNRIAVNAGVIRDSTGQIVEPGALDVIEGMGVAFYDSYGKARPWMEFLTDLRAAWHDLEPERAEEIANAFGNVEISGEDASDVMAQFSSDLMDWQTEWNGLQTDVERQTFADNLASQFDALGISMYDSSGRLREFGDVAHEAEIKLGGLTDAESQFYGKKIGSLRGIAAFLRLMNATNEEVDSLYEKTMNAEGAAEEMAKIRLDNLWGDVQMFNAALDVLKVAIFDDIKGPLREIVQYGTEALDRITDAINENGLTGGIEQLGVEIEAAAEKFEPMLRSIGAAAAPLVTSLFETVLPTLTSSAVELGSAFGEGLFTGISNSLGGNGVLSLLSGFLGETFGNLNHWVNTDMSQGAGSWTGVQTAPTYQGPTMTVGNVEVDAAAVQAAIDASADGLFVTIGGIEMSVDNAQDLLASLTPVGEAAGTQMSTDIGAALGGVDVSGLLSSLSGVGVAAGESIRGDIQSALSGGSFSINVKANVTGLPEGTTGTEKHARSMFGGSILRGATVFGLNSNGQPLVGGDAGPEAVVGVGSLDQMIHQSVGDAFGSFSAAPANEGKTLRDAVAGGLQVYGPELANEIATRVGAIVASAISRVATKPTVVQVGGKELATATADYNAIAANTRSRSYARGYGA